MKQLTLFPETQPFFGGEIPRKRKSFRPLSTKKSLHFVLKSKRRNLYQHKIYIEQEIRRLAAKFRSKVYNIAVNHDHTHFTLRIRTRREYKGFIRSLTGILARKLGKGIWALLPFSRIISWGRDFKNVLAYGRKNQKEASGAIPYTKRKDYYRYRRYKNPEEKPGPPATHKMLR